MLEEFSGGGGGTYSAVAYILFDFKVYAYEFRFAF